MFESLINIFKKGKKNQMLKSSSKDTAKERLHLVLMQDRANVSADFLDLMRKEIIEVIKKYIDIDEKAMDVRLTTETTEDGTQGAPALYANIPIINIKDETRQNSKTNQDHKIIEKIAKKAEKVSKNEDKAVEKKKTDSEEKNETIEKIIEPEKDEETQEEKNKVKEQTEENNNINNDEKNNTEENEEKKEIEENNNEE